MPRHPAIPGVRDPMKTRMTYHERFLVKMDAVVQWCCLLTLIAPHDPKIGPKGGRPPMLWVYFLQNRYALSDQIAEEALEDREALRRFAGIERGDDRIHDRTKIIKFWHLLDRHALTDTIFPTPMRNWPT